MTAINLNIGFKRLVNSVYYKIFKACNRFLILYGGAGSGKSVATAQKIIYRMLTERNHRYLVGRKVGETIRDSARADIIGAINDMGVDDLFRYSTSPTGEMTITCPNNNIIMFRGWDNVEKLKSIKDITGAWLEEASEFTENDIDQLNLRIRGKHLDNYKQIILSFNPITEQHWLKKRFFDNNIDDVKIIHTTYLDNDFIDDEYKENLEKLKYTNPNFYKVYALGHWGSLEGVIFSNAEQRRITEDEIKGLELLQGADWGYTNDPTAFCQLYIDNKKKIIYVTDGFYERGLLNSDIERKIKEMKAHRHITRGDSAEPKTIASLNAKGVRVIAAEKGRDSIIAGINFLQEYRIIVAPHLNDFMAEFNNYTWGFDKKTGKPTNKPIDEYNHFIDALRYSVSHLYKRRGKVSGVRKPIGI